MNLLTFDIEDWFHLLNNPYTKDIKNWNKFESRIKNNLDKILLSLKSSNSKASFFVLGWIARKYPDLIKKIDELGFEIGSHTYSHQLIFEQSKKEFKNDVEFSIKIIEDIIGKKVKIFRAPSFSITDKSLWAFDILVDLGIEVDSSIFPAVRNNGGLVNNIDMKTPFKVLSNNVYLKEYPISYNSFFGKKIVSSGGGYFRFFPEYLIKKLLLKNKYNMTYFHPRDFDNNQPYIKGLSPINLFKSYVGLRGSYKKFNNIINQFKFVDIATYDKTLDWKNINYLKI